MRFVRSSVSLAAVAFFGWCGAASASSPLGDVLTAVFVGKYQSCVGRIANGPEATRLRQVFPARPNDISLRHMAVATRPTPEEIPLLFNMHEQWVGCRNALLKGLQLQYPSEAAVLSRGFQASDDVWGTLVSGNITWGQANAARKQIANAVDAALAGEEPAQAGNDGSNGTYTPPSTTVGNTAQSYTNQHLYGNEYISPSRQGTYQDRWR